MAHLSGNDICQRLGKKIDNLTVRTPWNEKLFAILKELYSPEEAEFVVRMPYTLCHFKRLKEITNYD
jgi:hypothetical protein